MSTFVQFSIRNDNLSSCLGYRHDTNSVDVSIAWKKTVLTKFSNKISTKETSCSENSSNVTSRRMPCALISDSAPIKANEKLTFLQVLLKRELYQSWLELLLHAVIAIALVSGKQQKMEQNAQIEYKLKQLFELEQAHSMMTLLDRQPSLRFNPSKKLTNKHFLAEGESEYSFLLCLSPDHSLFDSNWITTLAEIARSVRSRIPFQNELRDLAQLAAEFSYSSHFALPQVS